MGWKSKSIVTVAVFSLLLTGCGGSSGSSGGGGGPTGPSESASNTTTAVNFAIGGIDFALSSMSSPSLKPSLKPFRKAKATDLKASVAGFYKGLKAYRAKAISPLTDIPCDSGSAHIDITPTGIELTFTDCQDSLGDELEYTDGIISFSETPTGFTLTITGHTTGTGFTSRRTRTSDGSLVEEDITDLTVTGTFGVTTIDCGGVPFSDSITMVIDGAFSFEADFDGDGMLDEDLDESVDSLSLSMTVSQISAPDSFGVCEPTDFTVSIFGAFAEMDNLDPDFSFSVSMSSSNPLTITWMEVTGGVELTINGSLTVSDSCFTGSITLVTTTPLFFPDTGSEDDGIDCPSSGVITVTGTWTGTITYTSGGVDIDNGSDGTVDETLSDCEDAATCV